MKNKIILRFAESGVVSEGRYWFHPETAVRIIELAKETKTPLLGFPAAVLRPARVQELLEHGWNYVLAQPPIENVHAHATQFVSIRSDYGLFFELILPEFIGSGLLDL